MPQPRLDDVIKAETQALYSVETRVSDAFLVLSGLADDRDLARLLQIVRRQSQGHVEVLEGLCADRNWTADERPSRTMQSMWEEARTMIGASHPDPVLDAMIVAEAQRVGHLKIAGYGTVAALAKRMGYHEAAETFARLLREEREADGRLSGIAETRVNARAASLSLSHQTRL